MFDFDFTDYTSNRAPSKADVYAVEIVAVEGRVTGAGNGRIDIRTKVTEGEFEGAAIRDGINLPTPGANANKLKSIWSSVLLTNGLALPMLLLLASSRGEFDDFFEVSRESIIQSFS